MDPYVIGNGKQRSNNSNKPPERANHLTGPTFSTPLIQPTMQSLTFQTPSSNLHRSSQSTDLISSRFNTTPTMPKMNRSDQVHHLKSQIARYRKTEMRLTIETQALQEEMESMRQKYDELKEYAAQLTSSSATDEMYNTTTSHKLPVGLLGYNRTSSIKMEEEALKGEKEPIDQQSITEWNTLSRKDSDGGDDDNLDGMGSNRITVLDASGQEVCRRFLKGKCKSKSDCRFSHEVVECPHCRSRITHLTSRAALVAHLRKCWKKTINYG